MQRYEILETIEGWDEGPIVAYSCPDSVFPGRSRTEAAEFRDWIKARLSELYPRYSVEVIDTECSDVYTVFNPDTTEEEDEALREKLGNRIMLLTEEYWNLSLFPCTFPNGSADLPQIKPCPFCGETVYTFFSYEGRSGRIGCMECRTRGPVAWRNRPPYSFGNFIEWKRKAIKAWNVQK